MAESGKQRLAYIDWLRGLACLGMFEVHCYDAWLSSAARSTSLYYWSRFSGTIPAPLFVFLTGISCALVTDGMRRKGATENKIAARMIRRGFEIFGFGLLFRVQEYILGLPWAPWTDLLRVDVLNVIGLSIVFMGVMCRMTRSRTASGILAAAIALAISCTTPPLWTTWRPRWLPWFLESYINGVHTYNAPQAWLFPIFPWTAFAFAGLAAGFILMSDWSKANPSRVAALFGGAGVAIFFLSRWLDARSGQFYAVYDYWHTSPNFFLARTGLVLVTVWIGYAWCRWGLGQVGFSPLIQLGQASLLVYWVHIEFVYGRFSLLKQGAQGIPVATLGLLVIFALMVLLAMARTRTKGRGREIWERLREIKSGQARTVPSPAPEG
jgi:uncharacterized membrane protein